MQVQDEQEQSPLHISTTRFSGLFMSFFMDAPIGYIYRENVKGYYYRRKHRVC